MTKRNFAAGADRSQKLTHPRGLPGGHYGPAGRGRHLKPDPDAPVPPPAEGFALTYASYASQRRALGYKPLTPKDWIDKLRGKKPRRAKRRQQPATRR